MVEFKVGTTRLAAQELNTLNARQPENNDSQTNSLYKDSIRPLYRVEKPVVHEHDILGNPVGSSPLSRMKEHFDVQHSIKEPVDVKPSIQVEHIFVESIVRK